MDVDRLVRHFRALAGLDGDPRMMGSKLLWNLGTFWLGNRKATVYFARRLFVIDCFDEIFDALKRFGGKTPGVVLAWGLPSGRHVELPLGHRMLNMKDILIVENDSYRLDMAVVKGALTGEREPLDDLSPVRYNVDYSIIRVNGREFVFTGVKQQQLIGMLVTARERGEPKCRTSTLLGNVEASPKSNTLSKFFSGRSDWKDLIGYGDGYCWLKV